MHHKAIFYFPVLPDYFWWCTLILLYKYNYWKLLLLQHIKDVLGLTTMFMFLFNVVSLKKRKRKKAAGKKLERSLLERSGGPNLQLSHGTLWFYGLFQINLKRIMHIITSCMKFIFMDKSIKVLDSTWT